MQITLSTEINASLERAFDVVNDNDKIVEWAEGVEEIIPGDPWNPDNPVGSRFKQRIREGGRVATYDGEVVAYDKPRHIAVRLSSSQFTMRVDYRFSAIDAQRTRLDYAVDMTMHTFVARIMGRLFAGFTRKLAQKQVGAFKAYAERG